MKKLLFVAIATLGLTFGAVAQEAPAKSGTAKKEMKKDKKADAKKEESKDAHLKKDGTVDKRFKDKKEAKRPMKKDGTPDKRFKENKELSKCLFKLKRHFFISKNDVKI